MINRILLRQLCCEQVRHHIQTTPMSAVSRHVLSSEKALIDYLQCKLLENEPGMKGLLQKCGN